MTNNVRFATFNVSLNRNTEGGLITDLSTPNNSQGRAIAEIIQRNNPDVLLLNEFDYDAAGKAIGLFQENYLGISQNGVAPVEYPYVYLAPSNTGIPSGFDLDNDGTTDGAGDAYGFGFFPGQFGMVLLSKYPIDQKNVRTFQNFLWQDMPDALLPDDLTTTEPNDYYSPEELEVLRLSSKSHWDIPVEIDGEIVNILASHPTPPVFDGEEDRNGKRNHDEIRFWADYVTPGNNSYIYDDRGKYGGLAAGARFVIVGDQNADPFDGDSTDNAILQLLDNPLINTDLTPSSDGAIDASIRTNNINDIHLGNPAFDTGDFNDATPGNLRVDYVLPSNNLEITDAGVFWTTADDELFRLIGDFDPTLPVGYPSSDHRLVYVDTDVVVEDKNINRQTITNFEFLGEVIFATGFTFADTEVGGISGLAYDAANEVYYALSDDRSNINDARFYTVDIDLSDGSLDEGDIAFQDVTTLLNVSGRAFSSSSLDPEGIALTNRGTLFISSEGDGNNLVAPFIAEFSLGGQIFNELNITDKFLPKVDKASGIQNNQAFESLTITPDGKTLFTATENALFQDGERSSLEVGSPVRIIQYDLETREIVGEFLYETDPIPVPPDPVDSFADNGLVELLAIDNAGTLLALERSFAVGVGNNIRLYEINLSGVTNISSVDSLLDEDGESIDIDETVDKRLLLDFSDLGMTLDNSEAVSFGERLPDGRQTIIVASDNNFNDVQKTQFLAFAIDTETIPTITPITETPSEVRFGDPQNPDPNNAPDADDPAIYLHPDNPEESFVITTFKNGGLRVYDLEGKELQSVTPDNIRYNNVDIAYNVPFRGFVLPGTTVDIAIASDRANDTIAVFTIDPETKQLTQLAPGFEFPESIFGVDDGEATAYGLATYTSLVDAKVYAFVSQAGGNKIAQLEISPTTGAADEPIVNAEVVRIIEVPVPDGEDPEDFQIEGMVVDRETGYLYVGQEEFGIWKYNAEPSVGAFRKNPLLIDTVESGNIAADVEGLTIYYGEDGNGYLLASSQGDNTFAIYDRAGTNSYLGSFAVEGVEESDGADVINVPLGDNYPAGLLVVQDGSNTPEVVFPDPEDGEIQNFNTNFKYVSFADFADIFPNLPTYDPNAFDPRNPAITPKSELLSGTQDNDLLAGTEENDFILARSGDDLVFANDGDDRVIGGKGNDFLEGGKGNDRVVGGEGDDTLIGVDFSSVESNLGQGEIDTLVGNRLSDSTGSDTFVLGNQNGVFYDDGDSSTRGEGDKARILGFNSADDKIQLYGSPDLYRLNQSSNQDTTNASILYKAEPQASPELIARIIDVNPDLSLDDPAFIFIEPAEPLFGTNNADVLEAPGSNSLIVGNDGDDTIDLTGGGGNNRADGNRGDDTFILGSDDRVFGGLGDDKFFTSNGGNNTITGEGGADRFWIASAEIPESANIITDFTPGEDVIGIAGLGIGFDELTFTDSDLGAVISANGSELAIFTNINADSLNNETFFAIVDSF